MRRLTRVNRFDKRAEKILLYSHEELQILIARIKKRGEGILEPHYLLEDIKATKKEDSSSLSLIKEVVVLHSGVAFALHLDDENWGYVQVDYSLDTVETLDESDYLLIRRESMKVGAGGYLQHVREPLGVVLQHVIETPAVGLQQHVKGFSGKQHPEGKIKPVFKRMKQ